MQGINAFQDLLDYEIELTAPEVSIYVDSISPRLTYVCDFIFNRVLKCHYKFVSNREVFSNKTNPRINYSNQVLDRCLQVQPEGLLAENGIRTDKPKAFIRGEKLYFFETSEKGHLGFDVFSAVFYFISRYEEWQPFTADKHGRFEFEASLLYQNKAHLIPRVDQWIEELGQALCRFNPELQLPKKSFSLLSTIDLDNLFAFRYKGLVRSSGATVKDLLKGNIKNIVLRLQVLAGRKADPFDIYEDISAFCKGQNIPLLYFFLFRTGTEYDRTLNPLSRGYERVFNILKRNKALFGLHPSYDSSVNPGLMEYEVKQLSTRYGEPVKLSRQHFLRFNIRSTPPLLTKLGVKVDFSMGFAGSPGFRAGTAYPFYYYDFTQEKTGDLLIVPFCAMDGAYLVYSQQEPERAFNSIYNMALEIKKTGGIMATIFHESTISDHLYKGYGTLYKKLHLTLKELRENEN